MKKNYIAPEMKFYEISEPNLICCSGGHHHNHEHHFHDGDFEPDHDPHFRHELWDNHEGPKDDFWGR